MPPPATSAARRASAPAQHIELVSVSWISCATFVSGHILQLRHPLRCPASCRSTTLLAPECRLCRARGCRWQPPLSALPVSPSAVSLPGILKLPRLRGPSFALPPARKHTAESVWLQWKVDQSSHRERCTKWQWRLQNLRTSPLNSASPFSECLQMQQSTRVRCTCQMVNSQLNRIQLSAGTPCTSVSY